ncbi:very short patch repair endonuclease [Burkholderia stagnalis]|uniref:very short patch repair endonuclease n=1 Tax=Burkholderia stagnalis TaxID=1503054 RepID=UPI000F5B977E|nr:DNA mismatch endonuclease Vsr [Burkholderia stagnalis]RQP98058.1 DNA mismatch endonuclease Vsr [Burkholderia stagnalis]RQY68855.1 DNA mismatch endonuclease Vsr [Burkholderia stagnalis]
MVDVVDAATRSRMMSGIRGSNTRPEIRVRQILHALGFRFRLHDRALPGKPDIILPRWRAVILVHGCFWHGHDCPLFRLPATRPEFWENKIRLNKERDAKAIAALANSGWRVCVVWECALKGRDRIDAGILGARLAEWIRSTAPEAEISGQG